MNIDKFQNKPIITMQTKQNYEKHWKKKLSKEKHEEISDMRGYMKVCYRIESL